MAFLSDPAQLCRQRYTRVAFINLQKARWLCYQDLQLLTSSSSLPPVPGDMLPVYGVELIRIRILRKARVGPCDSPSEEA
jgi:hypothetical protein